MTNDEIIKAINEAYQKRDLAFLEYINQLTWGYKVELKREFKKPKSLTKPNNERMDQTT